MSRLNENIGVDLDKASVKTLFADEGVDMAQEAEWFDALYDAIQEHIVAQVPPNDPSDLETINYLQIGTAVVDKAEMFPGEAPGDIFVIAVQDVWAKRSWILPAKIVTDPERDPLSLAKSAEIANELAELTSNEVAELKAVPDDTVTQ